MDDEKKNETLAQYKTLETVRSEIKDLELDAQNNVEQVNHHIKAQLEKNKDAQKRIERVMHQIKVQREKIIDAVFTDARKRFETKKK